MGRPRWPERRRRWRQQPTRAPSLLRCAHTRGVHPSATPPGQTARSDTGDEWRGCGGGPQAATPTPYGVTVASPSRTTSAKAAGAICPRRPLHQRTIPNRRRPDAAAAPLPPPLPNVGGQLPSPSHGPCARVAADGNGRERQDYMKGIHQLISVFGRRARALEPRWAVTPTGLAWTNPACAGSARAGSGCAGPARAGPVQSGSAACPGGNFTSSPGQPAQVDRQRQA